METNDTDFNEINKIRFLDKENNCSILEWKKQTHGLSCGNIKVDIQLLDVYKKFFSLIKHTEYTDELRDIVFSTYIEGKDLGTCSQEYYTKIFNEYNLSIFDPRQDAFRKFSKTMLLDEMYSTKEGAQCNVFIVRNEKRLAVFKKNNKYILRNGEYVLPEKHILVPNVMTRNIVQDAYFNPEFYIAGPSEAVYIKKLKKKYRRYGVKPAKVKNRMSGVLVPDAVKQCMHATGFDMHTLLNAANNDIYTFAFKTLSGFDKKKVTAEAQKLNHLFITKLKKYAIPEAGIEKVLYSALKKNIGLKRKQLKAVFSKELTASQTLQNYIFPEKKQQQRWFSFIYFLNLLGRKRLIQTLYDNYVFKECIMEVTDA
jgi:uncharacterized protein YllA (UPF0747 family)